MNMAKSALKYNGTTPFIPAARTKRRNKAVVIDGPAAHSQLKSYLLSRRLMVERSMRPEVSEESKKIDYFLAYLRSLETDDRR